jgi:PST family polysaccharide transporter
VNYAKGTTVLTSQLNRRAASKRRVSPFDSIGRFRPVATGGELRRVAVRSAGATVYATGLALVAQVAGTVILARLLAPADFGVVAMVTTFSLFFVNFGLNGFTETVIQCEQLDRYSASNLFWLNLSAGLVLAIAFAVAGSLLATFYRNPLVKNVAVGLSAGIFIAAASVIHSALLKRSMRFAADSANLVVGRAVNSAVAILLALQGWGYWALVAGVVAQQISMTVGAWWLCPWIPSLPRRTGTTGSMLRFAVNVYGRFGLRYLSQNIDKLLVGWKFNAIALGFYKKAFDLFALSAIQLTSPLHNVALATLSRLNHDPVRFRRYLVNSLAMVAFVGMAVGTDLALTGKDLIRLVLGPQWGEAGTLFSLFGPGIGVMLIYSVSGWIHLSIGRPDRWFRWTAFEFVLTALLLVLGLHWGPAGVAVAWTASFWLLVIPGLFYAGQPIQLPVRTIIAAVWKYAFAALLAGGASDEIIRHLELFGSGSSAMQAFARTAAISTVFGALYIAAVICLHRGCDPIYQLVGLLRESMPWVKSEAVPGAIPGPGRPPHEPAIG